MSEPLAPPQREELLRLLARMDECLIAAEDGCLVPARAIAALPPWRAVMIARAVKVDLEGGTLEELVAEAVRVGGAGNLCWPPLREGE